MTNPQHLQCTFENDIDNTTKVFTMFVRGDEDKERVAVRFADLFAVDNLSKMSFHRVEGSSPDEPYYLIYKLLDDSGGTEFLGRLYIKKIA